MAKKAKLSQAIRNVRSKTTTSSGEKRMSNSPSRSRRKVHSKDGMGHAYIKIENKAIAIKKKGLKKIKTSGPKAKALTKKR